MSTATSDIDICNLTLDLLGEESDLSDIDNPSTENEALFNRWYHVIRRALLRSGVFNFAIRRVVLTVSSSDPIFGYDDAYNIPNRCLRIVTIGDEDDPKQDFEIENGQILLDNDAGNLNLRYIYDETVVTKFDSLFVELLAHELAVRLGKKKGAQQNVMQTIKEERDALRLRIGAVDGQERPPRRIQRSSWKTARQKLVTKSVASPYTTFD